MPLVTTVITEQLKGKKDLLKAIQSHTPTKHLDATVNLGDD